MTLSLTTRAALGSLALAVVSPSALAQATDPITMASVVVTATRSNENAADVLADFSTISADDIARSNLHSVIELLQAQRGIEVARNGGPGTSASVFIRGADGRQTIVLVDGVRIGSATLGAANWSALPLSNIDHIEIVYGPLSTMYGADAIGGVVQIFTKRGSGALGANAMLGTGSDGARTASVGLSGRDGRTSYALSASRDRADGFSATLPGNFSYNPDPDGYTRDGASGQLVYALTDTVELGGLFLHSRLDAQFDSGPGYDARSGQTLDNVALFANGRITPQWSSHFQLTRAADKSGTDSSAAASGKSQIDTVQKGASWQNDIALGTDSLQLLLERRIEQVTASSTPALARERRTNSGAAAYHLKRDAHLASASVRVDDSNQYGSNTSGALGYGYRIAPGLQVETSAGTSFRAPTFNELYYPGFGVATNQPEHGRNAEASLRYSGGGVQFNAVYFHNRITDMLVTAAVCPVDVAGHPYGCAYNVDRGTLSGLSLDAAHQWGQLTLHATLDWQDPRDDTTGKLLPRRARRHGTLGLDYNAGAFKVGAELLGSGRRFDDVANRKELGGYGVLNLHASYAFDRDWSALVRFDNASDKRYELARTYATAGRTWFAGIRYGAQ